MSANTGARGRGRARGRGARPADVDAGARPGAEALEQAEVRLDAVAGGGRTVLQGPMVSHPGSNVQSEDLGRQAATSAVVGSGRAAYHGQGDPPRPGADIAGAQRGLGAMNLNPVDRGALMTRRRGALLFITEPHTRPEHVTDKRGTTGTAVQLVSNLFKLNRTPNFHLYQYHVSFNPEVPSKGMRRSMMKDHAELLGQISMFDGMILFLPIRLENESTQVFSVRKADQERIQITIRFTNEVPPTDPTCLQLYNIIFKRILTQNNMLAIGRNYYNPEFAVKIPQHCLEVWSGFATSILQFETSAMLIADVSHKIIHSKTALDVMYDIHDRNPRNFKEECFKKIVGQIVLTRYNNKTYRIDDIAFDKRVTHTFSKSERGGSGVEITYVDYFRQAYNQTFSDLNQPLLVSNPKAKDRRRGQDGPLFLPPEICFLTGLADDVRSDFRVMKDLAAHTRIGPADRMNRLKTFIETINSNELSKKEMTNWNLEFSRNLLTMQGRQLPGEDIFQGNVAGERSKFSYALDSADWTNQTRNYPLLTPAHLHDWVVVAAHRDQAIANDLVNTIQRVAKTMGIVVNRPQFEVLKDDATGSYVRALRGCLRDDLNMVLCVLPSNRKDRYDAIKTLCCVDYGVPSQVVLTKTLSKNLMSVATKITVQLCVKMGGEAWGVFIPLKNTMIVGIDTYHDSAKKGRSVAAFVASMNQTFTRYYSRCAMQSTHEELQNCLKVCMQAALKNYFAVNEALPGKVIVYRDGVGDGQLDMVHQHEVRQLRECLREVSPRTQLAVIVVKKRINSRFFSANRSGNPLPGTIIDTEATRPEWFDFFLISQSVRQGTVSPTHYNVIYDDNTGFKPDHFQRLTYKLCHLYYNWPGTIRVPAPCQYAHKMAFLVGQSLHRDPALALANKLFYL